MGERVSYTPVLVHFVFVDFVFSRAVRASMHRTIASAVTGATMHHTSAWSPSRVGAVDVRYVRALEEEVVEI